MNARLTSVKTWAEIEKIKAQLNRETIARRQTPARSTAEDRAVAALFGGPVRAFVDAQGRLVS